MIAGWTYGGAPIVVVSYSRFLNITTLYVERRRWVAGERDLVEGRPRCVARWTSGSASSMSAWPISSLAPQQP